MKPVTFRRSLIESSRSASDDQSLVNTVGPGQIKRFQPNLIQIFPVVWSRTDENLKVTGSKVKVKKTFQKIKQIM